ncbi:MAG TPA: response regulator [Clostridia bacterium]|nr:response regulator [Clostridia bacterium]
MGRVLIVNDSRFESMILKDLLSQLGYNVSITDEYDAVKQVQSFSPNVVLANYVMKDTFGDRLIEKIKSRNPEILCILTSNSIINRDSLKSKKVDAILKTPASKEDMEGMLNKLSSGSKTSVDGEIELNEIKDTMEKWKNRISKKKQFTT